MLLHVDISEIFIFIATRYGARFLGLPSLFFSLPSLPFFFLSPYFTPTFLFLLPCRTPTPLSQCLSLGEGGRGPAGQVCPAFPVGVSTKRIVLLLHSGLYAGL